MNRIILYFLNLRFICLFWFIFSSHLVNGFKNYTIWEKIKKIQDDANREIEKNELCNKLSLRRYLVFPDKDIIKIFFRLSDVKFKNCFKYFNVTLKRKRRPVKSVLISFTEKVSFKFENVSCGVYQVFVNPCKSNWQCAYFTVPYPFLVNVTNNCQNILRTNEILLYNESIEKEVIIPTAIFSILLVFAVGGLIYLIKHRSCSRIDSEIDFDAVDYNIINDENAVREIRKIHLYIFHYYDKKNVIKAKVEVLTDFLLQSTYFNSVKVIDSELADIFINPNNWLNRALEEKAEDGGIIKIIIIDAKENNMGDDYENLIYIQAIETLYRNMPRILTGYNTLFVARLKGIPAHSERIRGMVSKHRHNIPDDLIHLGRSLCSGSGLDLLVVEENFKRLFLNHPIQHLGVVEHV